MDPDAVRVELYADAVDNHGPECHELRMVTHVTNRTNEPVYGATIPASRAATDYTARAVPGYDVAVPLEDAHILWQR